VDYLGARSLHLAVRQKRPVEVWEAGAREHACRAPFPRLASRDAAARFPTCLFAAQSAILLAVGKPTETIDADDCWSARTKRPEILERGSGTKSCILPWNSLEPPSEAKR
jgi:hypothetical protein